VNPKGKKKKKKRKPLLERKGSRHWPVKRKASCAEGEKKKKDLHGGKKKTGRSHELHPPEAYKKASALPSYKEKVAAEAGRKATTNPKICEDGRKKGRRFLKHSSEDLERRGGGG